MTDITIADKNELSEALWDLPVTAAVAILFGGERFMWTSWGAIARDGETVAGIATVGDGGEGTGEPTIIGIMVLREWRRHGIGTRLLATVVEQARRRGLLPLRYDALTPSGVELARASGHGPAELNVIDQNFFGLELP